MNTTLEIIRGSTRLGFDAVEAVTNIVEGMYRNIAAHPLPFGTAPEGGAGGIAGLVHSSIRGTNALVRGGTDRALEVISELLAEEPRATPRSAAVIAALNGVLGDHLERSNNPLAIPMSLRAGPRPPAVTPGGQHLLVLIHGLCMNDLQFEHRGVNHGTTLAALGYTTCYLHYNSGRHVSLNGRELSELLEQQLSTGSFKSISLLGHSMGGLLIRSACHHAGQSGASWLKSLRRCVYLGTPHHGAVLERGGNWLQAGVGASPYTAPLAMLGRLRSQGVTDLRHGNIRDEDWKPYDRFEFHDDRRVPTALHPGAEHFAIAATLSENRGAAIGHLLGDGLVHPSSATGRSRRIEYLLDFDAGHCKVLYGLNHWNLLSNAQVTASLQDWFAST